MAVESPDLSAVEQTDTDAQADAPITTCVDSAGGCDSQSRNDNVPPTPQASINDVWAQYYTRYHDSPNVIGVCKVMTPTARTSESPISSVMHATQTRVAHQPPILIDSGASSSVVGMKWLQSWNHFVIPKLRPNQKDFHFVDGPACRSLGEFDMDIELPTGVTNKSQPLILTIRVDVVSAVVPMLIAQPALVGMAGKLDFHTLLLELPQKLTIQLKKSPSGHILLPGKPVNQKSRNTLQINPDVEYPASQSMSNTVRILSDDQVEKRFT